MNIKKAREISLKDPGFKKEYEKPDFEIEGYKLKKEIKKIIQYTYDSHTESQIVDEVYNLFLSYYQKIVDEVIGEDEKIKVWSPDKKESLLLKNIIQANENELRAEQRERAKKLLRENE